MFNMSIDDSKLPKELKTKTIDEIITRIEEIEDASVGVIVAQDIIDIVLENLGNSIYNLAIQDASKVIKNKVSDLEVEISLLEKDTDQLQTERLLDYANLDNNFFRPSNSFWLITFCGSIQFSANYFSFFIHAMYFISSFK